MERIIAVLRSINVSEEILAGNEASLICVDVFLRIKPVERKSSEN